MSQPERVNRRDFLGTSLVAAGAGALLGSNASGAEPEPAVDADLPAVVSGAKVPCAKIGNVSISRVLLGGNLVSGFMHSRDLKYVNSLFRAYCTEDKMLETLTLAEECGINTVFESGGALVRKYNEQCHGHMQFIPHIAPRIEGGEQELKDEIQQAIDIGAAAVYVWGVSGDKLIQVGAVDRLARAVEWAKDKGLLCGVGSHSLEVPIACEKHGVPCDFYVKTLHSDDYPSALPKEQRKEYIWIAGGPGWNDNMWCINPEETIAFMKTVQKPWLAFKVLAAGAIAPRQGFAHAFRNGADLIAVGMFDFQLKENCELACRLIRREAKRERPWYG